MSSEQTGELSLIGISTSLISVPRFERALERFGERLLERVFTLEERRYAARKRNASHNLAGRFAAKCAGRRLLRRHNLSGLRLRDLEIVRRPSGEPTLALASGAERELGEIRLQLSLTHDADFAVASLWAEGRLDSQ